MSQNAIKHLFQPRSLPLGPSVSLLLLRFVAGLAFMFHGWGKIQNPFGWMGDAPVPGLLQFLAALSEFGGGFAWIIGLVVPLASFGILCTMIGAAYMHALVNGDPFVGPGGSYELALVYLAIAVVFIVLGPGRLSVDAKLFGEKSANSPKSV